MRTCKCLSGGHSRAELIRTEARRKVGTNHIRIIARRVEAYGVEPGDKSRREREEVGAISHEDEERERVSQDELAYASQNEQEATIPDAASGGGDSESSRAAPTHCVAMTSLA